MRKPSTDYLGAFRQLWLFLTLLSWGAVIFFLITGETGSMLQVSKYGTVSMGTANVFSALIVALFSTLLLIFLFLPSKAKRKEKK
ncbi:MAG: hypothetical protein ACOVP7_07190 [Lacibacter sp.]